MPRHARALCLRPLSGVLFTCAVDREGQKRVGPRRLTAIKADRFAYVIVPILKLSGSAGVDNERKRL
jgi:hypothetical protein